MISYIRFKRTKLGLGIEIEPTCLISIGLTFSYGLEYGIIFIILPNILSSISGIGIGLIVNTINKIIVVVFIYYYWLFFNDTNYLIYISIFFVLLTDIIGYFIRKKFG